jgi:hypothetical protein
VKPCLVIPDLHHPRCHQDALAFCIAVQKKYALTEVVFMGDILDLHAVSYHEKLPELEGPDAELEACKVLIEPWKRAFPKAMVCIGNHDSLFDRKAITYGIPKQMIARLDKVLGTKGWLWRQEHIVPCGNHHVVFRHSWGPNIELAMMRNGTSVVAGHWHSKSGVVYAQTSFRRMFGMQLGCLIQADHAAFSYNRQDIKRPLLNVGKIVDGEPAILSMNLNSEGRWTGEVP